MARTVLLGDPSWSTADDYVLQRLTDRVEALITYQCNGMHLKQARSILERHDPRIRKGRLHHAYLLYGPRVVFAEGGQLKLDVRGLVYEPMAALVGKQNRIGARRRWSHRKSRGSLTSRHMCRNSMHEITWPCHKSHGHANNVRTAARRQAMLQAPESAVRIITVSLRPPLCTPLSALALSG